MLKGFRDKHNHLQLFDTYIHKLIKRKRGVHSDLIVARHPFKNSGQARYTSRLQTKAMIKIIKSCYVQLAIRLANTN